MRKTTVSGQDVSNVVTEENQDKPPDTLNASVGTDQALVASGEGPVTDSSCSYSDNRWINNSYGQGFVG